jgi:hypothetical protein
MWIPDTWPLAVIAFGIALLTLILVLPSRDQTDWIDEHAGSGDVDDESWGLAGMVTETSDRVRSK